MKWDINFLYFLAARYPVGLYDSFFLKGAFRKYRLKELEAAFCSFAARARAGQLPRRRNLYVHVPFCAELCGFCHCARTKLTGRGAVAGYIQEIDRQLARIFSWLGDAPVGTVYFGGGSPSLLSERELERLFGAVRRRVPLAKGAPADFEAHPAQVSLAKARLLHSFGVERLSLGVQSFDPDVLKAIGRRQSLRQAAAAVQAARTAGIRTLNIDLVAGLPAQTVKSFVDDVRTVVAMGADIIHLTPFSDIRMTVHGRRMSVEDFLKACRERDRMIREGKEVVRRAGYRRYGFEAFARSAEHGCRHEHDHLHYGASIIGVGPFANGILSGHLLYRADPVGGKMERLAFSGCSVDKRYAMAQFLILNIFRGMPMEKFRELFGEGAEDVFHEELAMLCQRGIVRRDKRGFCYHGDRSLRSLFEYFALTRVFYGPKVLRQLKELCRAEYRLSHPYSFEKDAMLAKMEDHWFLQLYYDVGL